ncbi:hypothetical protein ACHQM5_012744 [Ranunculus cassubicifolius]
MKGLVIFGTVDLESGRFRDHLTIVAESLSKARSMIHPPVKKVSKFVMIENTTPRKPKEDQQRKMLKMEEKELADKMLRLVRANLEKDKLEYERSMKERELTRMSRFQSMDLRLKELREKRFQKRAMKMDYRERAKREEEVPLINEAFQKFLAEEQVVHEQQQQQEVELSRLVHLGHLQEKHRLARMLDNKRIFVERISRKREVERDRLVREREEAARIRKDEREIKRKLLFYIKTEEDRLRKLKEIAERERRIEMVKRLFFLPNAL